MGQELDSKDYLPRAPWWSSTRGWLRDSPLLVRLTVFAGAAFVWGLTYPFQSAALLAALFFLAVLAALVWSVVAAFAKDQGFLRRRDASRWVRIPVWLVVIVLAFPSFAIAGESVALSLAPSTVTGPVESGGQDPAELEATEAEEQAALEAERAAEEEARRLEEARRAETERVQGLLASVNGISESEALEALAPEGLTVRTENKCDPGEEGTVIGGEVKENPSFVTLFVAKSPSAVPDVVGTSEAVARASIEKACYQMKTVKSYAAFESDGNVVTQEPMPGEMLDADVEIEVMLSARPTGGTKVSDSVGRWEYLGPQDEEWSFSTPFAKDGKLFIPIEAAFSTDMSWRDEYENGSGYGTATIVDEFNKEVPVEVLYGKQSVPAGETQNFTPVVPLTDLNDQTPTKVFLYLSVEVGGTSEYLTANFTMTW